MKKIMITAALVIMSSSVFASSTTQPSRAALDSALKQCASSVATDSSGRPDMAAMDACMTAAGFTKPTGNPPHEHHHGSSSAQ